MILKFLHWNILFTERIENILALIRKLNPDIICLNELSKGLDYNDGIDTGKYIGNKLNLNYFTKEYMDRKGDRSQLVMSGIFSRLGMRKKEFSYTKKIELDKNSNSLKGTVYIEVQIEINKKILTVGTDHLSYVSKHIETDDKIKETNKLIQLIKNKQSFIFSGDLNVPPNSQTIRQISKYLHSCGPDHSEKTAFTRELVDYAGWKTGFKWRLDYVFATKDIKVKSANAINTKYSDHLPILVEFEF